MTGALEDLVADEPDSDTVLIGYGTGVIVPAEILGNYTRAYNFHAASPAYPGRDPHHFAIYDRARQYGATAHVMGARVDEGEILGVERFEVPEACTPVRLLMLANQAMRRLFVRLGPAMVAADMPPSPVDEKWAARKSSRSQFERMCTLSPLVGATEFDRRFAAFDGDKYDNLTVTLHGHLFRIDKSKTSKPPVDPAYGEFTERGYKALVRQAIDAGYTFSQYGSQTTGKHLLWRHDLDFSVHRGLCLARIEVEENVRSTWFVNPHSNFYNINEKPIRTRLRRIVEMGHWVGLHFDPGSYGYATWTTDELRRVLRAERDIVQSVCDASVDVVSWHNPDVNGLLAVTEERVADMINCYSDNMRSRYEYASDSNGYWRFKSISMILEEGHERLQILTHPGWWTPDPMAPRDRIERCILGRALSIAETYDIDLARHGRRNIGVRDSI